MHPILHGIFSLKKKVSISDKRLNAAAFFLLAVLLAIFESLAQDADAAQDVSGAVRDGSGGLSGVNVVLKGGRSMTITDADGRYALTGLPKDAVLIFSYIGFVAQEIAVEGRTQIDVEMLPDIETLSEVVVVGYGTQSKVNVTGSISTIKLSATQDLPNTNIAQTLRGRAAGVIFTKKTRPGKNHNMLILGTPPLLPN